MFQLPKTLLKGKIFATNLSLSYIQFLMIEILTFVKTVKQSLLDAKYSMTDHLKKSADFKLNNIIYKNSVPTYFISIQ